MSHFSMLHRPNLFFPLDSVLVIGWIGDPLTIAPEPLLPETSHVAMNIRFFRSNIYLFYILSSR